MGNPTTERELHHANVSDSHHVVDAKDTTQPNTDHTELSSYLLLTITMSYEYANTSLARMREYAGLPNRARLSGSLTIGL